MNQNTALRTPFTLVYNLKVLYYLKGGEVAQTVIFILIHEEVIPKMNKAFPLDGMKIVELTRAAVGALCGKNFR